MATTRRVSLAERSHAKKGPGRGAAQCALAKQGSSWRESSGNRQESLVERSPGSGRSQLARERSGNRQGNRLSSLDTGHTETKCTVVTQREEPNCSVVTQRERSQTVV